MLKAAEKAGVDIPVMCFYEGLDHFASCMVCMVKNKVNGQMLASCTVKAEEGMDIITGDEDVFAARKAALELLLSDHTGDCQAPCQLACPAHMDIPLMNRLLGEGNVDEALKVVMYYLVLSKCPGAGFLNGKSIIHRRDNWIEFF